MARTPRGGEDDNLDVVVYKEPPPREGRYGSWYPPDPLLYLCREGVLKRLRGLLSMLPNNAKRDESGTAVKMKVTIERVK